LPASRRSRSERSRAPTRRAPTRGAPTQSALVYTDPPLAQRSERRTASVYKGMRGKGGWGTLKTRHVQYRAPEHRRAIVSDHRRAIVSEHHSVRVPECHIAHPKPRFDSAYAPRAPPRMQGKRITLAGFRDLDRPEGGGKVAAALRFMGASVSTWASPHTSHTPAPHTVHTCQHAPGCRYWALANTHTHTHTLANLRGATLGACTEGERHCPHALISCTHPVERH